VLESTSDPRLGRFWELFEEQDFFESHEVLEELWMETSGGERDLYKGLIQIAVSLHHLQTGNLRGARKVFGTACDLLKRYQPRGAGVRLDRLVEDAAAQIERAERAAAAGGDAEDPRPAGPRPEDFEVRPVYDPPRPPRPAA
jgi:hypothetical protein